MLIEGKLHGVSVCTCTCKYMYFVFSKAEFVNEGPCESTPAPSCHCPHIYNPVCGADNLTYDNTCLMACKYVMQIH